MNVNINSEVFFIQLFQCLTAKATNNSLKLKLRFKFSNNSGVNNCNVTLYGPVQKKFQKRIIVTKTVIFKVKYEVIVELSEAFIALKNA